MYDVRLCDLTEKNNVPKTSFNGEPIDLFLAWLGRSTDSALVLAAMTRLVFLFYPRTIFLMRVWLITARPHPLKRNLLVYGVILKVCLVFCTFTGVFGDCSMAERGKAAKQLEDFSKGKGVSVIRWSTYVGLCARARLRCDQKSHDSSWLHNKKWAGLMHVCVCVYV